MSLDTMLTRLNYAGGNSFGRIKQQKLKSLQAALKNDYNSRLLLLPNGKTQRGILNIDNLKSDYDKKYVSIEFSSELSSGDVFKCIDDDSYWMVYLPDLVEIAYLRAEIVRCRYQLEVEGTKYWVYFQGPTETDIRWNEKSSTNWNDLNYSGTIYIKRDDNTLDYFKRFTKIKIDDHMWQVKVVDSITVPGIIELEIEEYYDSITDDIVEVYKADTVTDTTSIIGKSQVNQGEVTGYQINAALFNDTDSWTILDNDKVTIKELQNDGMTCIVSVAADAENTFTIQYGSSTYLVLINVASSIFGETKVYPYGTYTYKTALTGGTFSINNTNARIRYQADGECEIEIVTGRKGSFILTYTVGDTVYQLPVKILSL